MRYLVTCEHATARVPAAYAPWFDGAGEALRSHRGSDLGAAALAEQLAAAVGVTPLLADASRLLVECNRSQGADAIFSEWSRRMPEELREAALEHHWRRHRERVAEAAAAHVERGALVAHVGVHTFTPVWDGVTREIDVAWLFDPARPAEVEFVDRWQQALAAAAPALRLRRNEPYQGTSDGLTTDLRRRFPADRYLGVEIEVNQRFPLGPADEWRELRDRICATAPPASRSTDTPLTNGDAARS